MKVCLNVLSGVGLLLWAACFALGFNFGVGGNLPVSIVLGMFLLGVMALCAYLLKRLCNSAGHGNRARLDRREKTCMAIYLVAVAFSSSGVARFITVESWAPEVASQASVRMNEVRRVFSDKNAPGSYLAYLAEKDVALKGNEKREYERLKSRVESKLDEADKSIGNWNPFTVCENISLLDNEPPMWANELEELSMQNESCRTDPYEAPKTVYCEDYLLEWVKDPIGGIFNGRAIMWMIMMQLMIVLPGVAELTVWKRRFPVP